MKRFIVAALAALAASAASIASARDDEPSSEQIKEAASLIMSSGLDNKMSEREIANSLASEIIWLEKIQLICPSYYYVNARRARYEYLLRQGAWAFLFDGGKTATSIMNGASAKRNQEFYNSLSKKDWCEGIKAFGRWQIFEADQ